MKNATILWILAAVAIWIIYRQMRAWAATTSAALPGAGPQTGTVGTAQPTSAATASPDAGFVPFELGQMDAWGRSQTYTAQPNDGISLAGRGSTTASASAAPSAGSTSFPGDDLMSLAYAQKLQDAVYIA
jgi:hypothetical protein